MPVPTLQRTFTTPSSAVFGKVGQSYAHEAHRSAQANGVPAVHSAKGQNNELAARPYLKAAARRCGRAAVVLIGVA